MNKVNTATNNSQKRPVSPCQGVCTYSDKAYCLGCFRTPAEISNWFYMEDDEKWQIIERVTPQISAKYQK